MSNPTSHFAREQAERAVASARITDLERQLEFERKAHREISDAHESLVANHDRLLTQLTRSRPSEAVERAVALAIREWVHESPLNRCNAGSDTCDCWPVVDEIMRYVSPALVTSEMGDQAHRIAKLQATNETLNMELAERQHPVYSWFYRNVFERMDPERAHYLGLDGLAIFVGPHRWRAIKRAVRHQRRLSALNTSERVKP